MIVSFSFLVLPFVSFQPGIEFFFGFAQPHDVDVFRIKEDPDFLANLDPVSGMDQPFKARFIDCLDFKVVAQKSWLCTVMVSLGSVAVMSKSSGLKTTSTFPLA